MEFRYAMRSSLRYFGGSNQITSCILLCVYATVRAPLVLPSTFSLHLPVLATTENETHACKCKIPFHAHITFHKLNFSEKCKEE